MKLLAIDGNSILNRAFYGIRLLSNRKGVYTNAVFGFMNIYFKHLNYIKPDCTAVAFDMRKPTFRHQKVETYKANRKGMPDELAMQLPLIKELLTYMGIRIIECEGFEADDILGTLSKLCTDTGNQCEILTGDKDSLQLINDYVTVHLVGNKETVIYDTDKFHEVYGFEPVNLIDLKALMGDSSDNISGVKGIGEKTAMTLIKKWHTIDNLYSNLDDAGLTKSVYNKLSAGKTDAEQSRWLARIVKNVPLKINIQDLVQKPMDTENIRKMLKELEMYKLLEKLEISPENENTAKRNYDNIQIEKPEEKPFEKMPENPEYADFLFDGSSLSVIIENTVYKTDNTEKILEFFESSVPKRTFSAKKCFRFAIENNSSFNNMIFDAELAGYLLEASSSEYTIENLCSAYEIPYFSDIQSLPSLCSSLYDMLREQDSLELLEKIEMPFTEVLASMEYYGIKVDADGVRKFGDMLKDETEGIEEQIYFMAGEKFNIQSPKQLGVILFEKMNLPFSKKTKTGYSTSAEVLEQLRDKDPIIDLILKYRQFTKLNSTYVEGLLKTVKPDGRIHSVFRQTETRTGRISSAEPNMQNIPVRTETGRNMRKFFVADEGKILLDADYSQIELRIMAHMSNDSNMIDAFVNNADIHTSTAAKVFHVDENMVTPSMRSFAKAVNFGIIYGIGAYSLSKDINVSVKEAKHYISEYFSRYPDVEKFIKDTVRKATADGYVTTLFGRRRNIPELSSSNRIIKASGERIAMNTPIQGTAADIIKKAMINVFRKLKESVPDAHLILQVHDELIVECSPEDAEKAGKILHDEMENACKLRVPLVADVKEGHSWYDAKG
ncbi:MAG TPA: DNA polymerase I [Ruminococcus sp.]|nr:DNA polymerase I [Ruminococcus sp.]